MPPNEQIVNPKYATPKALSPSEPLFSAVADATPVYEVERGDHKGRRPPTGCKSLPPNDIDKTPHWSQVTPLIDRLIMAASGHAGEFLVSTVGSEDPETGAERRNFHFHPDNDQHARKGVLWAIKGIATGGDNNLAGFNCYVGMALMKPGLANERKGTEDDVVGVLAAPLDFDGKHDPATRQHRLPLPPHAETETSPGQFQTWYFFDRPYPVAEAKPVLTALARAVKTDHTQSCEHLFRVPGTLNWPTRKKIAAGRSHQPWRVRLTIKPEPLAQGISLAALKAAILAKYPDAFDRPNVIGNADFDWDTPLKPGDARELKDATIIDKLAVPPGGDRSAIAYGVIRQLAERRYTPAQVRDKLAELYSAETAALGHYDDHAKGFDASLEADIRRAFVKPIEAALDPSGVFNAYIDPAKPPPPTRRDIKVAGGRLPEILDAAEHALIEQGTDLFQRGDMIVRPGREAAIRIRDDQTTEGMRLFEVSAVEMREHLTAAGNFLQWDGRKGDFKRIDCPEAVAAGYLARKGRRNLRRLTAIIDAPTMRPDGTIMDHPGYDRGTGLYLIPRIAFPAIPVEPMRDDALAALAMLKGLVNSFPFVSNADCSVWLSAVLTAPIRAMLPTAPLFIFDAPAAGSGKGKLVDTAATIATGRAASVFNQGRSEEETEKRLGAILMGGDLCVNMDNCTLPIEGDFLCSVLTAGDAVRVRILGRSEAPKLPIVATMFATGNNSTVRGDMTRRALRCTIDPGMERPETREFDFDPVKLAQRDRGKYLGAVLTVLRAHAVARRPQPKMPPFGSFEQWSRIVRAALVWLDEADPCETMKTLAADDEERATLAEVLDTWHAAHGTDAIKATDAKLPLDLLRKIAPSFRGDSHSPERLGRYLKRHERRVIGGLRLMHYQRGPSNNLWRIEKV